MGSTKRTQFIEVANRAGAPAGAVRMSDTMRAVLWVTGVAFGVAAPGAFAQAGPEPGVAQTSPVLRTLDANHDERIAAREPGVKAAPNDLTAK